MKIRAHHLETLFQIIEKEGEVPPIDIDLPDEKKYMASILQQCFKEVYQTLIKNPDLDVVIINSLDGVCIKCPNSDGIKCTKYLDLDLDKLDNEALIEYGFSYDEYSAKKVIEKLTPQ